MRLRFDIETRFPQGAHHVTVHRTHHIRFPLYRGHVRLGHNRRKNNAHGRHDLRMCRRGVPLSRRSGNMRNVIRAIPILLPSGRRRAFVGSEPMRYTFPKARLGVIRHPDFHRINPLLQPELLPEAAVTYR